VCAIISGEHRLAGAKVGDVLGVRIAGTGIDVLDQRCGRTIKYPQLVAMRAVIGSEQRLAGAKLGDVLET
jgi:hypothetical protein